MNDIIYTNCIMKKLYNKEIKNDSASIMKNVSSTKKS